MITKKTGTTLEAQAEMERANAMVEKAKAIIEYIGALDYPEILEEEEEHE